MITAILDGSIDNVDYKSDPIFGLNIPVSMNDIPENILDPRKCWKNQKEYDKQAIKLSNLFKENFKKYGESTLYLRDFGPK